MAASAAASVVWLTTGALAVARGSTLADLDLGVGLTSGFLFVTGTFNGLAAGFAATLAAVLGTTVLAAEAVLLLAVLAAGVAAFVLDTAVLALPAGLATTVVFFSTGLLDLAAAVLALPAVAAGVFAGFFIAFAIGSLPSGYARDRKKHRSASRFAHVTSALRPRKFVDFPFRFLPPADNARR